MGSSLESESLGRLDDAGGGGSGRPGRQGHPSTRTSRRKGGAGSAAPGPAEAEAASDRGLVQPPAVATRLDPNRFASAPSAPEPVASTVQVPEVVYYHGVIRRPACPRCSSNETIGYCTKKRVRYYRCEKCQWKYKAQKVADRKEVVTRSG